MKHSASASHFHCTRPGTRPLLLFASVILFACQKENKQPIPENTLGTSAKEWYYGSFKKSGEWKSSPLQGKKLPDWKRPIYKKLNTMEIVEFPLVTSEKTVAVPSLNLSFAERQRIAEASLSRIVFIKKQNLPFLVRELTYIPSREYLAKKGADISSASIASSDNDFTGRIIVRTWGGSEKLRWNMNNGIRGKKMIVTASNDSSHGKTASREECPAVFVCTYTQHCTQYYGTTDNFLGETCDPWELQSCELETPEGPCDGDDPGDDPCQGMSQDDCNCQLLGIGCGPGNNEEEDQCASFVCPTPTDLTSTPISEVISYTKGVPELGPNGIIRTDQLKWSYNDSYMWGCHWKFFSTEETDAEKVNGIWRFKALRHISISREGTLPLCVESVATLNSATGTILNHGALARMDINATIRTSITCCRVCNDQVMSAPGYIEWPPQQ